MKAVLEYKCPQAGVVFEVVITTTATSMQQEARSRFAQLLWKGSLLCFSFNRLLLQGNRVGCLSIQIPDGGVAPPAK